MSTKKFTKTALKANCQWHPSLVKTLHLEERRVWVVAVWVRYLAAQWTSQVERISGSVYKRDEGLIFTIIELSYHLKWTTQLAVQCHRVEVHKMAIDKVASHLRNNLKSLEKQKFKIDKGGLQVYRSHKNHTTLCAVWDKAVNPRTKCTIESRINLQILVPLVHQDRTAMENTT